MTGGQPLDFLVDKRFWKPNQPMMIVPISQEMLTLVGAVVVHWGRFESIFDEHLDVLVTESWSLERDGKLKSQFTSRRKLFVRLSSRIFAGHQSIVDYFQRVSEAAADLRWKRDVVAHGLWASVHPADPSAPVRFQATGKRSGKAVTLQVTKDLLQELWQSMGILSADLATCSHLAAQHALSLPEREIVHAFMLKARQKVPR